MEDAQETTGVSAPLTLQHREEVALGSKFTLFNDQVLPAQDRRIKGNSLCVIGVTLIVGIALFFASTRKVDEGNSAGVATSKRLSDGSPRTISDSCRPARDHVVLAILVFRARFELCQLQDEPKIDLA